MLRVPSCYYSARDRNKDFECGAGSKKGLRVPGRQYFARESKKCFEYRGESKSASSAGASSVLNCFAAKKERDEGEWRDGALVAMAWCALVAMAWLLIFFQLVSDWKSELRVEEVFASTLTGPHKRTKHILPISHHSAVFKLPTSSFKCQTGTRPIETPFS